MKYIDADKLRKEVKRLERAAYKSALGCADSETRKFHEGKALAYQFVDILLDSLQQEQPEVDLEKEIIRYKVPFSDDKEYLNETTLDSIARHFYELGLRRAAEMYDEIEYNRQRAEEK